MGVFQQPANTNALNFVTSVGMPLTLSLSPAGRGEFEGLPVVLSQQSRCRTGHHTSGFAEVSDLDRRFIVHPRVEPSLSEAHAAISLMFSFECFNAG